MMGQYIGKGNDKYPCVNAVKQEGNHGFSAGAQGKIAAMGEGAQRHDQRGDGNKCPGKGLDAFLRIVNGRKKSSHHRHDSSHNSTAGHAEKDHFVICFLCLPEFSGTKELPHYNSDTASKLNIYDIKKIRDGGGDIKGSHHLKSADRVTLDDHRHAGGPEHFIDHQGSSFDQDIL